MAGVFKEFWAAVILALFYPNDSWLNELENYDELVDNNAIHMAECGADPNVVRNNNTWPLVPSQRIDKDLKYDLETFDTEPTHVTKVDELETNYPKAESVLRQHVNKLRMDCSTQAAFNLSPATHTPTTPVLATTGADRGDGTKALTFNDVTKFMSTFNAGDLPTEGRVLVLHPYHEADLMNEDMKQYKTMMEAGKIAGFKVYTFSKTPLYDPATKTKQPYGALTGAVSSFAFVKTETIRAISDADARISNDDATWVLYRGALIGAQLRFLAVPKRAYGIGAIYSANA